MRPRDVVKRAARIAARNTLAKIPEGAVRWQDEPQVQTDGNMPSVQLSTVSLIPERPAERRRELVNGDYITTIIQTFIWNVQFSCESWMVDAKGTIDPFTFMNEFRASWYFNTTQEALTDAESPVETRHVCKMVDEAGDVRAVPVRDSGQTLAVYVFEIEFRYSTKKVDPVAISTIESVILGGSFSNGDDDVQVDINAVTQP